LKATIDTYALRAIGSPIGFPVATSHLRTVPSPPPELRSTTPTEASCLPSGLNTTLDTSSS